MRATPPVQPSTLPPAAFPALTGSVVDVADLLTPEEEAVLAERLAALEASTKHQFVVVTVASLGAEPVEDYTRGLGNHWGIGRKGVNDGVILLVAPNQHLVRIEVGTGLEAALTDEEATEIIDTAVIPAFREGKFGDGIKAGAERVIAQISEPTS